jgi:hypothetical protein
MTAKSEGCREFAAVPDLRLTETPFPICAVPHAPEKSFTYQPESNVRLSRAIVGPNLRKEAIPPSEHTRHTARTPEYSKSGLKSKGG